MFNSQYRFTVKKSSDKIKLLLCIKEEKHINRPFEVCLPPVLLKPFAGKQRKRSAGEQGLKFRIITGIVLYNLAGRKPQNR